MRTFILLFIMCTTTFSVDVNNLLIGYDKSILPGGNDVTVVNYTLTAPYFLEINEINTHLWISVVEYMSWVDTRLQYTPAPSQESMKMNSYIYKLWVPITDFKDRMDRTFKDRRDSSDLILYPNGTLIYTTRRTMRIRCDFSFRLIPFDKHTCSIIAFFVNGDKDAVIMNYTEEDAMAPLKQNSERIITFLEEARTFDIDFYSYGPVDVYPTVRFDHPHSGYQSNMKKWRMELMN